MKKALKLLTLSVLLSLSFLVFDSVKTLAITAENLKAYNALPPRLPDDSYNIKTADGSVTSNYSRDCPDSPVSSRCKANPDSYEIFSNGDESHQYITLSNASINDNTSRVLSNPKVNKFAKIQEFEIFTLKPGNKTLRFQVVNRDLGDKFACHNLTNAYYYKGRDDDPPSVRKSSVRTDQTNCQKTYTFPNEFPADAFQQIGDTGIYKGRIVLEFDPNRPSNEPYQTSFHLATKEDEARLGYIGARDNLPPIVQRNGEYSDMHGWLNQYPANFADDHTVSFYFRPICETAPGTNIDIAWWDVDYGSKFQSRGVDIEIYRIRPGSKDLGPPIRTIRIDDDSKNEDYDASTRSANYGPNQPYAYVVQFKHVQGGNGISFYSPYNSGDARIPCPPPPPEQRFPDCRVLRTTLQPHTVYRFSVFSRKGNYLERPAYSNSTFPNSSKHSTNKNSDGSVRWASFNRGPPQQVTAENSSNEVKNYEFNFDPPSGPDRVTYLEAWLHNSDGSWSYTHTNPPIVVENCYVAECKIRLVNGRIPGRPSGVEAGKPFDVEVSVSSIGKDQLPLEAGGTPLGVSFDGRSDYRLDEAKLVDGNYIASFTLNAHDNISSRKLIMYPDYPHRFRAGGNCEAPVDIYKHFNLELNPHSELQPDDENPTEVWYEASVEKNIDEPVQITTRSRAYKAGGKQYAFNPVNNFNDRKTTTLGRDKYTPDAPKFGDKYCTEIYAAHVEGYAGPNDTVGLGDEKTREDCAYVSNKPYFHAFGGDVIAGGGFGANCTTDNGGIYAFLKKTGSASERPSGSGVQIGALSIGPIEGFSSALIRDPPPTGPVASEPIGSTGLTFANADPSDIGTTASRPSLGGRLGTDEHCIDYWQAKGDPLTDTALNNVIDSSDNTGPTRDKVARYYKPAGIPDGIFKINASSLGNKRSVTVYVEGNAHITGDLTYAQADTKNGWGGVTKVDEKIPSLRIIAKGNIYIDPNVKRLDGLYVAQENEDTKRGGSIFSCSSGSPTIDFATLWEQSPGVPSGCRSQLVVNGSFVAQHVFLTRSFGTNRDSKSGERFDNNARNCGDSGITHYGDCAAEIFNFSPEVYLAEPADGLPEDGPTTGLFQYITSLSPVL